MYQLKYDIEKQTLLQVNPSGEKVIINDNYPSPPEYSVDEKKAIYISPLEWECPGSLYLYNLENGHITELVKPDDRDYIPKYAIWINNETIAVIIGFGSGTVSVGGNVYIYDLRNDQLKQITHYTNEIQITKINIIDGALELDGIQYTDDNLNVFKEFKDKTSIIEHI